MAVYEKLRRVRATVTAATGLQYQKQILAALDEAYKRRPFNQLFSGALPQNVLVAASASPFTDL